MYAEVRNVQKVINNFNACKKTGAATGNCTALPELDVVGLFGGFAAQQWITGKIIEKAQNEGTITNWLVEFVGYESRLIMSRKHLDTMTASDRMEMKRLNSVQDREQVESAQRHPLNRGV